MYWIDSAVNQDSLFGPLIFRSGTPVGRYAAGMTGALTLSWTGIGHMRLTMAWNDSLATGEAGYFYVYLVCEITFLLMLIGCIILYFMIQRVEIYENGIVSGFRPLKMVFLRRKSFIPFNEVERIGILSGTELTNTTHMWFLMKDGTVAEFDYAGTEWESRERLAPLLREKMPYAMTLPIYRVKGRTDFRSFAYELRSKRFKYRRYDAKY